MGIWTFVFDHQKWHDLYEKNCSLKTSEEWYAEGKPNILLGLLYLSVAIFFELSYIPFMIAMLKKEFFQYSCYKLMFMMAIYDICIVPCNGIIIGIQVLRGQHYCHNPLLYYLASSLPCVGYYGVTMLCIILAIDRFLEICFPRMAAAVFGGRKAYFWMCIPILYQGFTCFHLNHTFNIKIYAMHHDPFHFIEGMENNPEFNFERFQTFFMANNCFVISSLVGIYSALLIVSNCRTTSHNMPAISKVQKQMTKQTIIVCGEIILTPFVHIFMLYYEFPIAIEVFAHFTWICLHGDTPLIYFILNKSLRRVMIESVMPFVKFPKSIISRSRSNLSIITPSNSNRIQAYANDISN